MNEEIRGIILRYVEAYPHLGKRAELALEGRTKPFFDAALHLAFPDGLTLHDAYALWEYLGRGRR